MIDILNGSILYKKNFSSTIKPIIHNDYVFFITNNNFLISMNFKNGKILYSYNLDKKIANYLNTKPKKLNIKNLLFADNKIFIFLQNSYILVFEVSGEVKIVKKLPSKTKSNPILINEKLMFINNKNRFIIVN